MRRSLPIFVSLLAAAHAQDLEIPLADSPALSPETTEAPLPETPAGALEDLTVQAGSLPPAASLLLPHPVSELDSAALAVRRRSTLGETLSWEPGVSSSSHGAGVSRPILRGFEGVRLRTLRDHLSSFDLSDLSPDHGVAVDPALLHSVEIHRGPASLLYGPSAIGGAVNALTQTFAPPPEKPLSGWLETRFNTADRSWAHAANLDLRHGPFTLRATGSLLDAENLSIPGNARTAAYDRLEQPATFDPSSGEITPLPNPRHTLPNSAARKSSGSLSLHWTPDHSPWQAAFAYAHADDRYGVPYFFPGDATDLFGDYSIESAQHRYEARLTGTWDDSPITRVDWKAGWSEYRHGEIFSGRAKDLGRDFTDTFFRQVSAESRLEIHHRTPVDAWHGIFGLHGQSSRLHSFRTVVPPPDTDRTRGLLTYEQLGLFTLQSVDLPPWLVKAGARLDAVRSGDESLRAFGYSPSVTELAPSTSISLSWTPGSVPVFDHFSSTWIASASVRPPTASERYAFWNNAGIGRFLIGGDLDGIPLESEESFGLEWQLEARWNDWSPKLNLFHYRFPTYINLVEAVEDTGGFGRAVRYVDHPATFTGFEAELVWDPSSPQRVRFLADGVRATDTRHRRPIPRMPPLRLGARWEWEQPDWSFGIELRHAFAQDRTQPPPRPELPASSYTLLNADFSYRLTWLDRETSAFVQLSNLLDEDIRLSTSFRKDTAPQAGRSLTLGLRQTF